MLNNFDHIPQWKPSFFAFTLGATVRHTGAGGMLEYSRRNDEKVEVSRGSCTQFPMNLNQLLSNFEVASA